MTSPYWISKSLPTLLSQLIAIPLECLEPLDEHFAIELKVIKFVKVCYYHA